MGGKGNVIKVTGVRHKRGLRPCGWREERFCEVPGHQNQRRLEGRWDSGTAQTVVSDFLATQPTVDGVWVQGGTTGVMQAFKSAGIRSCAMAGEAENAFREALGSGDIQGISVGQDPRHDRCFHSGGAGNPARAELPRVISMPLP